MRHAVRHLKRSDPVMATIIERVGPCRITYREPVFETIVRSIMFQQLNGTAARTIYERLLHAAGGNITPESLNALSDADLRSVGLSRQKIGYLRDLIERTLSGEIDFARLPEMSDDDVIEHNARQRCGRVDRAHVSDFRAAPAERHADARLRRADGGAQVVSQTQAAQTRADHEAGEELGAILLGRVLVSVAKHGCDGSAAAGRCEGGKKAGIEAQLTFQVSRFA